MIPFLPFNLLPIRLSHWLSLPVNVQGQGQGLLCWERCRSAEAGGGLCSESVWLFCCEPSSCRDRRCLSCQHVWIPQSTNIQEVAVMFKSPAEVKIVVESNSKQKLRFNSAQFRPMCSIQDITVTATVNVNAMPMLRQCYVNTWLTKDWRKENMCVRERDR